MMTACSSPGLTDTESEPVTPQSSLGGDWEVETAEDKEEALLAEQLGDLERECNKLLLLCDEFTAEIDTEIADFRRLRRRTARACRDVATVRSSSAQRSSGERVTEVLRRRTGVDGTRTGDMLLVRWSDGSCTWEPYDRVEREEDWDTLNALRTFEAGRAALAPDRGLRPFGWDREVQRLRKYKQALIKRRRRFRRGLPVRDGPPRPAQFAPAQPRGQPQPAEQQQREQMDWGQHLVQPQPYDATPPAYGYGGGWRQAPRTDFEYLQTLPLNELRIALQQVQDFTPEHFELLGRLDEDNKPKCATAEQLSRIEFGVCAPGGECVICMCDMTDGEMARLPCGHIFHGECVRQLTTTSRECPLCRCEI